MAIRIECRGGDMAAMRRAISVKYFVLSIARSHASDACSQYDSLISINRYPPIVNSRTGSRMYFAYVPFSYTPAIAGIGAVA